MTSRGGTSNETAHRIFVTDDHPSLPRPRPSFCIGDLVREPRGEIAGKIVRRGGYPGEWIVADREGYEIACLDTTLELIARPKKGWARFYGWVRLLGRSGPKPP